MTTIIIGILVILFASIVLMHLVFKEDSKKEDGEKHAHYWYERGDDVILHWMDHKGVFVTKDMIRLNLHDEDGKINPNLEKDWEDIKAGNYAGRRRR